ncbi:MAG: sulfatase [Fimbriimonadaceae bacterium]|nr:sulfatase [Fimbriimonadaceae bacterium]
MRSLQRRDFLSTSAAALLAGATRGADRRPSFVFLMTDDQRWDSMSCAGHPVFQSPQMDRLAREGAFFQRMFVTNSLCGPSRACNLTGLYSHSHGVRTNDQKNGLPPEQVIFPEVLRRDGYETAFIGKWHSPGFGRGRTWDYYFGFRGQGAYFNPPIAENQEPDRRYDGYMDDILTDHAISFLKRDHRQPFCLLLWFKSPHRSWQCAPRYEARYRDVTFPRPPTFDADLSGKPRAVQQVDMRIGDFEDFRDYDDFMRRYYRCLCGVDDNVGRVLGALDELGLTDDTCCVYSSDNGFFNGEYRWFDKRLMYEPSLRVPLLVRYPRRIAAGQRPTALATHLDLAPTLLDLAGAPPLPRQHGRSLVPLLTGPTPADWRRDFLYEYYEFPGAHSVRKNRGVRGERYKLIHYFDEPQEWELLDLQEDPHETRNLIDSPAHQPVVAELRERLTALRRASDDPDLT